MSWTPLYDEQWRISKPSGCPLRRSKPKGPIKGCEETCRAFEACVEHCQNERTSEEWQIKEVERQRALFR